MCQIYVVGVDVLGDPRLSANLIVGTVRPTCFACRRSVLCKLQKYPKGVILSGAVKKEREEQAPPLRKYSAKASPQGVILSPPKVRHPERGRTFAGRALASEQKHEAVAEWDLR